MTKNTQQRYSVGDKVRVNVAEDRVGNNIRMGVSYSVKHVSINGLGVQNHFSEYRAVNVSDVEPWDNAVTVHTDANGITREYREVKRRARVGEYVKVVGNRHPTWHGLNVGEIGVVDRLGRNNPSSQEEPYVKPQLLHKSTWAAFGQYVSHADYVVLEPTDIVIVDGQRYRTVERKASVGERIMLVAFDPSNHVREVRSVRKNGDVGIVSGNRWYVEVTGWGVASIVDDEYVVLTPVDAQDAPSVEQRIEALEERNASLEARVATLEAAAKAKVAPEIVIHASSTESDVSIGKKLADALIGRSTRAEAPLTRDEIIEKAKQDVETLLNRNYSISQGYDRSVWFTSEGGMFTVTHECEFVVNRQKRTVVAMIKACTHGHIYHRGIAHCAADDCFNVWIGRAIALRRALGLDVPSYYTSAPKPTKVNVGDVIERTNTSSHPGYRVAVRFHAEWWTKDVEKGYAIVLDDSHDFGGDRP